MAVLIGTSGYSYPDWVGHVYAPGTPEKDFLKHYCRHFPMTELNFSYYHQPDARTVGRMVHVTPDTFRFAIKAYKGLTHELSAGLEPEVRVFKEGIRPLIDAGRLASVVMQFPYSFHYTTQSRRYLDALCGQFEGIASAVEFRNAEWQRDSVYKGLERRRVALVNVDEPLLAGLPRPTAIVTAPHAYVRFHGRNAANWWNGDNTSRYDYAYSGDELAEWVPRVRQMAAKASTVMVLFNNHFQGKAAEDARKLKAMLAEVE